ncbi:hypothetical protein [Shewanella gelidii]|uniref:Uncharacterized protein n=1 Tax=Shewanella gelidii TaxID=1642821 RepID=A0A917JVN9_9GAMM|nr:hypothetical protein [Shewanella gelidii]MCL1098257.1 hypothetical protein [Shewanella gelidii]GGI83838.1 hypothetical protein GCM10009332_21360 [Shewanella gelidii]
MTAIGIVIGGNVGIKINIQKIENMDNNPIYIELSEKVESGELEVNKNLGLILIQGMREAHVDAGSYLDSIFKIFIYVGIFLIFLVLTLAFVTWRLFTKVSVKRD